MSRSFLEDEGGQCVLCGCTDESPCTEGCVWAREDLCSRCAERPRLDPDQIVEEDDIRF